MSHYSICKREDAHDVLGDYPGEMRFFGGPLETEQVAFTYRRMPQHTGGKGGYGHRHKRQEEVYFVISGRLQFKLEDEVIDVEAGTAVRVAPNVVRSIWNEDPQEAELAICSIKVPDTRADAEIIEGFWPTE